MNRVKNILTRGLLAFALISLGFILGKHAGDKAPAADVDQPVSTDSYVAVYYLHATFRCVTCNTIEAMTRNLLDRAYSAELASGAIRWKEDDFQKNKALAKQFGIVASCVVVARVEQGETVAFNRLDDVWTLMKDANRFDAYISEAIDAFLEPKGPAS